MIIAIVPAPGHEALVADGPFHERPACLYRWRWRDEASDTWALPDPNDDPPSWNYERALVLHAPGDPRLGMLRAREATYDGRSAAIGEEIRALRGGAGPIGQALHLSKPYFSWPLPEAPEWLGTPCPVLGDYSHPGRFAWALAHLLVQRGIAAEVIVLPADKAKE